MGKWDNRPFQTLEEALVNRGIAEKESIKILDRATVPIVKLADKQTDIRVDISFNMGNGVKSAELIKVCISVVYCNAMPPDRVLFCSNFSRSFLHFATWFACSSNSYSKET